MNTEELGYFLFMECEELKKKMEIEEELREEEKVNLELNPLFNGE